MGNSLFRFLAESNKKTDTTHVYAKYEATVDWLSLVYRLETGGNATFLVVTIKVARQPKPDQEIDTTGVLLLYFGFCFN